MLLFVAGAKGVLFTSARARFGAEPGGDRSSRMPRMRWGAPAPQLRSRRPRSTANHRSEGMAIPLHRASSKSVGAACENPAQFALPENQRWAWLLHRTPASAVEEPGASSSWRLGDLATLSRRFSRPDANPMRRVSATGGALTEPFRPLTFLVASCAPSHRLQPADSFERTRPESSLTRNAFHRIERSRPHQVSPMQPGRNFAHFRLTNRAQNPAHPFAVFAIAPRVSSRVATSVRLFARLSPCAKDAC